MAKLIPQPTQIIGVEIDPVMLAIGRKYFELDKIPDLKIVNKNANFWLLAANSYFDYILVDLYIGDTPPDFIYSPRFLKKLSQLGKLVIINHLVITFDHRQKTQELIKLLESYFNHVSLQRRLTNLLIICS